MSSALALAVFHFVLFCTCPTPILLSGVSLNVAFSARLGSPLGSLDLKFLQSTYQG